MAKEVLNNASIVVNGTDLSNHCRSVTLNDESEQVDFTSFSSSLYKETGKGMKEATIEAEFFNDYAASSVDATLNAAYNSSTAFPVVVKKDAGATSATNPSFTLQANLFNYSPISGEVGAANMTDVTFHNGGTAGLTRGTA